MMIKKIVINNFMPFYGCNEINLDTGIINLIGEWSESKNRSNRAGKSSFIEAIVYCLYGECRAKKEIEAINDLAEDSMYVKLIIDTDIGEIEIIRGRTLKNTKLLEITGVDLTQYKSPQDCINEIIGLDYNSFILSSYFAQGDINSFMELSLADKKRKLSNWIQVINWSQYEKKAKDRLVDLNVSIDKLTGSIESFENQLKDLSDIKSKKEIKNLLTLEEKELNNYKKRLDKLTYSLGQLSTDFDSKIDYLEDNLDNLKEEIEELNDDIHKRKNKNKELKELNIRYKELKEELENSKYKNISDLDEKLDELNEIYNNHQAIMISLNDQINKFSTIIEKDERICPILEEKCDRISPDVLRPIVCNLEDKKSSLVEKIDKYSNKIDRINDIKDSFSEIKSDIKSIKFKIDNLKEYDTDYKHLNEKLKSKNDQYEKINLDLKRLEEESKEIDDKISFKKKIIKDVKSSILVCENNIKLYNQFLNEIDSKLKMKKELKIALNESQNKKYELLDQANMYKFIQAMFSKDGIPMMEINNSMDELEDYINMVLSKLNTNLSIEITTEKKLTTYEEFCSCGYMFINSSERICSECQCKRMKKTRSDFDIILYSGGKILPFELDSGGGKTLISIAIRLAVIRLLKNRNKINFNILILDEIFGMLDEVNRSSVASLLVDIIREDFDQIFTITHIDIPVTGDQNIYIIKEENYSRIEVR